MAFLTTTPWLDQEEYEQITKRTWTPFTSKVIDGEVLTFEYFEEICRQFINMNYNSIIMRLGGLEAGTILIGEEYILTEEEQRTIKFALARFIENVRHNGFQLYSRRTDYTLNSGNISNSFGTFIYENLEEMMPEITKFLLQSLNLKIRINDPNYNFYENFKNFYVPRLEISETRGTDLIADKSNFEGKNLTETLNVIFELAFEGAGFFGDGTLTSTQATRAENIISDEDIRLQGELNNQNESIEILFDEQAVQNELINTNQEEITAIANNLDILAFDLKKVGDQVSPIFSTNEMAYFDWNNWELTSELFQINSTDTTILELVDGVNLTGTTLSNLFNLYIILRSVSGSDNGNFFIETYDVNNVLIEKTDLASIQIDTNLNDIPVNFNFPIKFIVPQNFKYFKIGIDITNGGWGVTIRGELTNFLSEIEGKKGTINISLNNYYTKDESDNLFVPKESLVNGSKNFIEYTENSLQFGHALSTGEVDNLHGANQLWIRNYKDGQNNLQTLITPRDENGSPVGDYIPMDRRSLVTKSYADGKGELVYLFFQEGPFEIDKEYDLDFELGEEEGLGDYFKLIHITIVGDTGEGTIAVSLSMTPNENKLYPAWTFFVEGTKLQLFNDGTIYFRDFLFTNNKFLNVSITGIKY